MCAGGTRRRRRRGHRYATSYIAFLLLDAASFVLALGGEKQEQSYRAVARNRPSSHSSRCQPSLAKRHSPQRRALRCGSSARSRTSRGGPLVFSSRSTAWCGCSSGTHQPRFGNRGRRGPAVSPRRHRADGLLRFCERQGSVPTAGDRGANCWRDNANDRRDVHSRRPSSDPHRAGASASTWAIPDAALHGPRAATNGGSCARHRCRRPRRAGRLAGSRSASAPSHWAQQPTSWRAKPMKLACTHRVRHEEQRFTL